MALYKADPKDGVAWVTGGSTGMGRDLALGLAREGYTVAVSAREIEPLNEVVAAGSGLAGRIVAFPCDVADEAAMAATVEAVEALGPIVLAVFNAGTYIPIQGERLDLSAFRKTFEVNLFGVLNGLVPVVRRMDGRGRGQLVLIGSVTSYFGLPSASGYGATKAALNNLAEGLRFDFDKMNIRIQVINPGFVDTPLTKKNKFRMPALMPVDRAAARIVAIIKAGRFESTFPRRFTWPMKLVRLLPRTAINRLMTAATGWKGRPLVRD